MLIDLPKGGDATIISSTRLQPRAGIPESEALVNTTKGSGSEGDVALIP